MHGKTTPRWGGVAFFVGVLPILIIARGNDSVASFIVASGVLVVMGMMDDLSPLNWKMKLAVMTAATTIIIFGGDITIHHLGHFKTVGRVELGITSIPFTYLGIIGITNAINLLDGLDGLAGGVSLLGFLFMGIAALLSGNMAVAVICFAYVGALGAFLLYNFPHARIFMGDAGSLFLGFSLGFVAMLLTQDATSSVDSMFPVLVLLIPIFDTLRVLLVRLLSGRNPFHADNLHLHYLMTRKNISPVHVALLFWSFTAAFGCIALFLTKQTSALYLSAIAYTVAFLSLFAALLAREQSPRKDPVPVKLTAEVLEEAPLYATSHDFVHKGETMVLKWVVVLGVLLLAAQVLAEESTAIETQRDKINYAIGVNTVRNFTRQSVELDLEMVSKGMRDAHSGGKLLMSEEEIRKTLRAVQEEVRKRQKMAPIIAIKEGQVFLAENGTRQGVVTLPSGLQYMVLKTGQGKKPTDTDLVICNYRGTLLNGAEFDRSYPGQPVTFSVREGGGIPGLSEALKLMPVRSKWRLFIPPQLAYGERGRTSIVGTPVGPNETIIVEVELLAIR